MPPTRSHTVHLPVLEAAPGEERGLSRRSFLQWLGSASLATLAAGCRAPKDPIAPYGDTPEGMIPGRPRHYASALSLTGFASGVLVTSWEGRPTKIEGNPRHPMNLGATGVWEQASILELYDPSRAQEISREGQPVARATFAQGMHRLATSLQADGGAGLWLLLEPTTSTTIAAAVNRLRQRFPRCHVLTWAPTCSDSPRRGVSLATGSPLSVRPSLESARVIASLDSDFLGIGPEAVRLTRELADGRTQRGQMNRLYAVEPSYSLTGSMADHRLPCPCGEVPRVARALLDEILTRANEKPVGGDAGAHTNFVRELGADLWAHRGKSVVLAGDRQPAEVHASALAINQLLGALGQAIELRSSLLLSNPVGHDELQSLADAVHRGEVKSLITDVFNPLYTLPRDLDPSALFARIPEVIYLSTYADRTSAKVRWAVPRSHSLESWSDLRSADGTVSLVQPLIDRLHDSLQLEEVLSALADPVIASAHQQLRSRWVPTLGETGWKRALQEGVVEGTAGKAVDMVVPVATVADRLRQLAPPTMASCPEISVAPSYQAFDGRFARNPWLQELPDPITKLTWDNGLMVAPQTAQRLGLQQGQLASIEANGATTRAVVLLVPGQAPETATLTLGYGQLEISEASDEAIGFDAYALRTSADPWFMGGARITGLDARHKLAITQGGELTQQGRDLAIAIDLENPTTGERAVEEHRREQESLYPPVQEPGYRWAMSIDLSRCTGCSACVVACMAENNIPTVGKYQVSQGREMQWIRIDRYYEGAASALRVLHQPTPCMHCENAPCEYVCPVNATVHSDEGLNEMVYNRCVGTRYCSNNCPYKVRRFNFLAYNAAIPPLEQMQKNPEVTVRSRGVMEKCTYCVQRIQAARIQSEEEHRSIADGEIRTACQQVCPARAITFGTLSDPASGVSRLRNEGRRYDMLHELGTRPRTTYLAKLVNPNPKLPPT